MLAQVLAVLIQVSIAVSVRLCGRGWAAGWWIGVGVQLLNLTYGLVTHTWGFLLGLVLVAPQFLLNALAWQKRAKAKESLIVQ